MPSASGTSGSAGAARRDRLLLYNKEDVVNMQELLRYGCAEMMKSLPGMENAGQNSSFRISPGKIA
jgi:hypothetical protein